MLSVSEINKTFGCVHLKWRRTNVEARRLSSVAKYGLVSIASIRNLVNTVKKNILFDLLDDFRPRRQSAELMSEKEDVYPSILFYVNRFFICRLVSNVQIRRVIKHI